MQNHKIFALIYFVLICLFSQKINSKEIKNATVVSVDNYIITELDIIKEIQFINFINKSNNDDLLQNKVLRRESINNLIARQIKNIETDYFKVFVSEKEVEINLYKYLSNLKINKEDFDSFLKKNEIDMNYLLNIINIDMKWSELIKQIYTGRININLTEINAEIENTDKKGMVLDDKDKLKDDLILNEKQKKLNKFAESHFERVKKKYLINFL